MRWLTFFIFDCRVITLTEKGISRYQIQYTQQLRTGGVPSVLKCIKMFVKMFVDVYITRRRTPGEHVKDTNFYFFYFFIFKFFLYIIMWPRLSISSRILSRFVIPSAPLSGAFKQALKELYRFSCGGCCGERCGGGNSCLLQKSSKSFSESTKG